MEKGYRTENNTLMDYNYLRNVGWSNDNACLREFFSPETVKLISKKITELTLGVDPHNRPIVVPESTIVDVMNGIYRGFRPAVGDIYSRYIVPNNEQPNMIQSMIDQTIEVIVSDIKNNLGMEQYNESLTAWVQLYGDFNLHGLRQHPPIKVLNKRPNTMEFHMRY